MPKRPLVAIVDDDESTGGNDEGFARMGGFGGCDIRERRTTAEVPATRQYLLPGHEPAHGADDRARAHQHLVASNHSIPTILITAYPDDHARAQALKSNVICFLVKPFAAEELLACIRHAIVGSIE